ncbi:tyrosine-type recombinase/integrase [Paucilactobacillus sp. N302-9]
MIKKSKTGWTVRVFYTHNGTRKSVTKTFSLKTNAVKWETEIKNTLQTTNKPFSEEDISLTDYFWKWYKSIKKDHVSPATQDRYRTDYNIIKGYFGDTLMHDINRMDYQNFLNAYAKNHAKNSVSKLHNAVQIAVKYAVADDVILKDFTQLAEVFGGTGVDESRKYLDKTDAEHLIEYLEDKVDIYNISYAMIFTSLMTGMRLAEVQGLTEDDYFDVFNRIQVKRTYNRSKPTAKNPFKPTKNPSSVRVIDIPEKLGGYLDKLIEMQHLFNKTDNPHKFIFINTRGEIPSSNGVNKVLARVLKKIHASKKITFHGLRHTHASYLLANGIKVEYVSKRLGHASIETTLKTYTHLFKETESEETDRTLSLLNKNLAHFRQGSKSTGASD